MSMRRRLLYWLLSTVLVAGLAATGVVFYQAREQANELFDYQLKQLAMTLRDRTFQPAELAQALQGAEGLDFVIDVWSADGQLVYESHPSIIVPPATRPAPDPRSSKPPGDRRLLRVRTWDLWRTPALPGPV